MSLSRTEQPWAVSPLGVAALIERAARIVHSIGYAEGLYPAQWVALRYFTEALPSSRTTTQLAHSQNMGIRSVASTVHTLVDKGLLARAVNPKSRCGDLITVTVSGHAILNKDPRRLIADVIGTIPEDQRLSLALGIEALVLTLLAKLYADQFLGDDGNRPHSTEPRP